MEKPLYSALYYQILALLKAKRRKDPSARILPHQVAADLGLDLPHAQSVLRLMSDSGFIRRQSLVVPMFWGERRSICRSQHYYWEPNCRPLPKGVRRAHGS